MISTSISILSADELPASASRWPCYIAVFLQSRTDCRQSRSNDIGNEIVQVEAQQAALLSEGKPASATLDERLEKLYRENVKLCEDVQHIIEGKSNEMNLLDSVAVLAGLREASEKVSGNPTGKLSRPTKKSTKSNVDDVVEEVASPRIRIGVGKGKDSRAGSVSVTREASVKLEDGAESVASSADGVVSSATGKAGAASGLGRTSNRLVLTKGEIVFCRHPPSSKPATAEATEGEGILCRVTAVIGEGKQRRYEVQDADTTGPAPPQPQRASVSQLIRIPEVNEGLGELPRGKGVMAMYPDTTTFYKAEVSENWKAEGKNGANALVKLNFQDDEVAREVERRFVLTDR